MKFSAIDRDSIERVYFIAGWKTSKNHCAEEMAILVECYPNAAVVRFSWNSDGSWPKALAESDASAVDKLLETLRQRPSGESRKTALVGHSLGARIAVRTVCRLRRKIHHLTLMGGAINVDDAQVFQAAEKASVGLIHLYNPIDVSLHLYKIVEKAPPLGLVRLPFFSSKTLSVSTNGLFSEEEAGIIKMVLPFIAKTLGGPARLLTLPLVRFLSSTHACRRYLIYYKNRLNGREESEFLGEIREFGDELAGGAANLLSDMTKIVGEIAGEWFEDVRESVTLTRDAFFEAAREISDSGKNMIAAVAGRLKKLFM